MLINLLMPMNPAAGPALELKDAHAPAPIGFELAIGWWMMMILLTVLSLWLFLKLFKRYQARRYRILALKEAKVLFKEHQADTVRYVQEWAMLLKRVALTAYPNEKIAHLSGKDWLQFLDKKAKTNHFTRGEGKIFMDGPYRPEITINAKALQQLGEFWIKRHQ